MFIGREQELNTLDRLYHTGKFEFAVIYGRRRVGKTALINRFTADKDTVFFTGVETNFQAVFDPLRLVHVLYGGSRFGIQGAALRQKNGAAEDQALRLFRVLPLLHKLFLF